MQWLETLVIVSHVIVAVALVGIILMQRGKGADMGAAFGGGASQTVFGSQGSGNFLTKMTTILAILFFVTSFSLALYAKQRAEVAEFQGVPSVQQRDQATPQAPTDNAEATPGTEVEPETNEAETQGDALPELE